MTKFDLAIRGQGKSKVIISSPELKASRRPCVRPFTFSKIFSETAWPIKAKCYVEHPWVGLGGTKVCVFYLDRIRTLVAMATYASHRLIITQSNQ